MTLFDGETIDGLLARLEIFKSNGVREVGRAAPFYVKLDRRRGHGFACEMRAARLAASRRIPVVEHLGCGVCARGNYLVTREWAGGKPICDLWHDMPPPPEFMQNFAGFVGQVCASGLWHGDFHIGNVLYRPESGEFALVDLRAVRSRRWFDVFHAYRMTRIMLELRRDLDDRAMIEALRALGIASPEAFFTAGLDHEYAALRREWPRRRAQILAGYRKFTRRENDRLVNVFATSEMPDCATVVVEGAPERLEKLFCGGFYLDLALIPHRRVLAFDRAAGRLLLERNTGSTAPEFASSDFRRRLARLGYDSGADDWELTSGGVRFTGAVEA